MADIPDFMSTEKRYFVDKDKLCLALGTKLKAAREGRNFTQEQLASLCGISRSSIANIEAGKTSVSLEALYQIAFALDIGIIGILP